MKVLYCGWNENSAEDVLNNLQKVADSVISMNRTVKEYLDGSAIEEVGTYGEVDVVFSQNYFPLVSVWCNQRKIPYISVVYDWPNYTLFDPTVYNECNHIYMFDRGGIELLSSYRVNTICYLPLMVDTNRLDKQLGCDIQSTGYKYDVSFVGNMYLEKKEAMFTENVPAYYSGYIDALVNAQQKIYGYNLVNEIINKDFAKNYFKSINGSLDGMWVPDEFVLATQINRLVTGVERRELLKKAGESFRVDLFTQSDAGDLGNVTVHGGVDYTHEMPKVFRESRINLNITLRSITTGVPLRVFDILGAGGFCLTNYQPDICEHFEDGKELVMFASSDEMVDKIDYYLKHEDERIRIAINGHEKVREYNYQNAYKSIFRDIGDGV